LRGHGLRNIQTVRLLGRGPTSDVHLCRDRGTGREVVIKRLVGEHAAEPELGRALVEEARFLARLDHPGIVKIIDARDSRDGAYLVREYVPGITLAALAERARTVGQLHYGHLAALGAQVCDALAHAEGLLDSRAVGSAAHIGEINGRGIVVTRQGVARLLDVAMDRPGRAGRTASARSDVLGVGATLFEAITGMSPQRLMGGLGPPVTQLDPDCPPQLESIVMSTLDPDVRLRCPSIWALHDRLEEFTSAPEHRSNPRTLAAWATTLIGNDETEPSAPAPYAPLASVTVSSSYAPPLAITSERMRVPGPSHSGWKWLTLVAGTVAVTAALVAVSQRSRTGPPFRPREPEPVVVVPPAPPPAPPPPPSAAAAEPAPDSEDPAETRRSKRKHRHRRSRRAATSDTPAAEEKDEKSAKPARDEKVEAPPGERSTAPAPTLPRE
jgi:serine/threonine protein kinase